MRLYAEDPEAGFLPSTGPVHLFRAPIGEGVRVDAGIETGGDVSPFYDPMIAKVIAHGATREEARRRLVAALGRDGRVRSAHQPGFPDRRAGAACLRRGRSDHGVHWRDLWRPLHSRAWMTLAMQRQRSPACGGARASIGRGARCESGELLNWASTGRLETIVEYDADGAARKYRRQADAATEVCGRHRTRRRSKSGAGPGGRYGAAGR